MHDVEAKNRLFAAQYLTEWEKTMVIFVSYGSLARQSDTEMKECGKITIITFMNEFYHVFS